MTPAVKIVDMRMVDRLKDEAALAHRRLDEEVNRRIRVEDALRAAENRWAKARADALVATGVAVLAIIAFFAMWTLG